MAEAPVSVPVETTWLDQGVLLLESVWDFQLFRIGDSWVTPGQIVIALAVMLVGLVCSRLLSRAVAGRLLTRFKLADSTLAVVQTILFYLLLVVTVLLALQTAGVPLTIFTIFGGAIALGIGFGSQNVVNNFISGLILMLERPVKIGDLIEVDDQTGRVVQIGARSTVLIDYRGICHIIPNSLLLERSVVNWHWNDQRVASAVTVGVAYGSDTAQVRALLEQVAAEHRGVADDPAPTVLFTEFGDNALHFDLICWIEAARMMERRVIESDLRFAIDAACRERGVVIAFPQRDVHLDLDAPVEVKLQR